MKRSIFLFEIILLTLCCSIVAKADNTSLELYDQSIEEELGDRAATIDQEIQEQLEAMLEINDVSNLQSAEARKGENILQHSVKLVLLDGLTELENQLNDFGNNFIPSKEFRSQNIYSSSSLKYIWKIPVAEYEQECIFATITIHSSDDIDVYSTYVPNTEINYTAYLFDQTLIPSILNASNLEVEYDTIVPISIPMISTDLIVFTADNMQYAIPFSARPDFLGVTNGQIYTFHEMNAKIHSLLKELSLDSSSAMDSNSGGQSIRMEEMIHEQEQPPIPILLYILIGFALFISSYLVVTHFRKRIHKDPD